MKLQEHSLRIVSFQGPDLDAIVAIEPRIFTAPWTRESYQELIPQPDIHVRVAKQGDRLVGYMLFQHVGREIELHTIGVEPALQRCGIGRKLVEHLVREAILRGVDSIFLQVRASNEAALGLYRGFGFVVVGVRPRYYQDNDEDALVMRWQRSRNAGGGA